MTGLIISVAEARELLGKAGKNMTDEEIEDLIVNLDVIAKHSLEMARNKLLMKRDAIELAELTYDIYQDKKVVRNEK
jgi:Ca2+-binding EF-hand superfamily protein